MAMDVEYEEREAKKAKRDLLFAVLAAITVAVLGWYGFGKFSESVKRAGLQSKAPTEAVAAKQKTSPIQVSPRAQTPDEPEVVAAAPVAPSTPVLPGRYALPPADTLLDLARDSIAENDMVTGALLALAALPENIADTPSDVADAAVRVLYDAYLNQREIVVFRGHGKFVRLAAFNPSVPMAVTASSDRTARLWDVATGKELAKLEGHDAEVWSAAFSPDGSRVITV